MFYIGLLSGVVFFIVLGAVFYIGYRMGNKSPKVNVDDEIKRKATQMQKDFNALMNYDLDTALQRKRV